MHDLQGYINHDINDNIGSVNGTLNGNIRVIFKTKQHK